MDKNNEQPTQIGDRIMGYRGRRIVLGAGMLGTLRDRQGKYAVVDWDHGTTTTIEVARLRHAEIRVHHI